MVNNFDQIRSLLKFENEGDCYYVQLLRRQSDDPHTNGVADPRYHGNMHSRSIKDYLIPSLEYFDKVKEDIITMSPSPSVWLVQRPAARVQGQPSQEARAPRVAVPAPVCPPALPYLW